jgi:hypothetical protein
MMIVDQRPQRLSWSVAAGRVGLWLVAALGGLAVGDQVPPTIMLATLALIAGLASTWSP